MATVDVVGREVARGFAWDRTWISRAEVVGRFRLLQVEASGADSTVRCTWMTGPHAGKRFDLIKFPVKYWDEMKE